jgi:hypothetical protein
MESFGTSRVRMETVVVGLVYGVRGETKRSESGHRGATESGTGKDSESLSP